MSWTGRLENLQTYFWPKLFSHWNFVFGIEPSARIAVSTQATGYVWIESGYTWLLWGGGIPLLAGFVFLVYATARRGWAVGPRRPRRSSVAGIAVFAAVFVITVLMTFDPHLTYRGVGGRLFLPAGAGGPRRYRPDGRQRQEQAATSRTGRSGGLRRKTSCVVELGRCAGGRLMAQGTSGKSRRC